MLASSTAASVKMSSSTRVTPPITSFFPLPEGIDADRVKAANKILKMGNVAVCKTTRAGFTTSAVLAAEQWDLKTLVIAPTRNILSKTVRKTVQNNGGRPCGIVGNTACKYLQKIIKKDPLLAELPLMKAEECDDCEHYDTCPVTEIERVDDFTTSTITYAKLEAVMLSSSDSAAFIKERLAEVDVIILDEAHLLSFPSLPQVDFDKYVVIPEEFRALRRIYAKWREMQNENREEAHHIEFLVDQDLQGFTGIRVPTNYKRRWEEISKFWGELIEFARLRDAWGTSDADIIALRDIITIMCGGDATISYISSNGCGRMIVTGSEGREYYALKQFFAEVAPKAKVIFVSGTLVERSSGYFSHMTDREIKSAVYPDKNRTNSMMFIHPSTWRFSHWDRRNGIERAIKEARDISESVGNQPIYLFAMNARLAKELKKALADLRNITVDYYRSADSIGVAQDARICIAVGVAELPKNVCDPLAKGKDENELFFDSQQLRINAVDCATWQAISRVKDPASLVESHVYFLGVRADVVSRIATWGTDRTVSATYTRKDGIESTVHCEEYLERPNIVMEERSDLRPCRRKTADYVDAIVPISDVIHARQNLYTFPYNDLIGDTVRFSDDPLRLYNCAINSEQFERNRFGLMTLFVTRIDKCGLQWHHANAKGTFGYYPVAPSTRFNILLVDHLLGLDTIALPPFDSDDNCYYVAVDFDDHDGNSPQSENVKKLTSFLKDRSIPSIVVKSGSNDGYHAFVPLVPTKTWVAHKFLKQLVKDAGMEDQKLEKFPRQKSCSSTKGGYGSQIKVPLGFNWKAGKQSMVVDPYTLEPVEFVEVTSAVKLRDLPEPRAETKSAKKKSTAKKSGEEQASTKESKTSKRTFESSSSQQTEAVYPSCEMRSCIRGVIDSGVQLKGEEGHQMRVAIAAEALRCGLNQEQAIDLFRKQKDFDAQTTRGHIQYIWNNNYKKYSCDKLQEQCGSFVKGYCEKCPLSEGEF